ncbi:MAG: hypothetical protein HYW22_02225 [Candidatus Aenigmarchaeota archaeon]|nr:hypothetical protein [Candidatus Aenigmarchaeota archaeon]
MSGVYGITSSTLTVSPSFVKDRIERELTTRLGPVSRENFGAHVGVGYEGSLYWEGDTGIPYHKCWTRYDLHDRPPGTLIDTTMCDYYHHGPTRADPSSSTLLQIFYDILRELPP